MYKCKTSKGPHSLHKHMLFLKNNHFTLNSIKTEKKNKVITIKKM